MQVQITTLKKIGIGFGVAVLIALGLAGAVLLSLNRPAPTASVSNVTLDANGKQIVQVQAKVGYAPMLSEAKANTPTILRMTTKSTFDCSSILLIPKLGVTKNLPPSGNTDIEIAPQPAGTVINATCGMGMYSFQVKFI
jgi:plastocyanin domain-containing protein